MKPERKIKQTIKERTVGFVTTFQMDFSKPNEEDKVITLIVTAMMKVTMMMLTTMKMMILMMRWL